MLAAGEGVEQPLSTILWWFDWRVYKTLPYPGPPRTWPASFLDEWTLVDRTLRTAEHQLADDLEAE